MPYREFPSAQGRWRAERLQPHADDALSEEQELMLAHVEQLSPAAAGSRSATREAATTPQSEDFTVADDHRMNAERIPPRRPATSLFRLGEEAEEDLRAGSSHVHVTREVALVASSPALSLSGAPFMGAQYASSVQDGIGEAVEVGQELPMRGGGSTFDGGLKHRSGSLKDEEAGPSWLHRAAPSDGSLSGPPVRDTLQHSREKVAARWFALRGLFDPTNQDTPLADFRVPDKPVPLLAIYSVAGGVGKTSMAASLARALAAQGERVLLVDATQRGVLPFYLGARELKPDVLRTFAPPAGSPDQPIHLVSYAGRSGNREPSQREEGIVSRISSDGVGFSRVIVDIASAAEEIVEQLLRAGADVLVPVIPDMSSVISLPVVRRVVSDKAARRGKGGLTAYLLVQFDGAQPLQLDVREMLQKQLGEELLPFSLRRSPAIAEALAEGMTVIDYAPDDVIAKDYLKLAAWVRAAAEPAREGLAQARWSER